MRAAALLVLLLAGCVSTDLPTASVHVDAETDDQVEDRPYDPEARPTEALYLAAGASHPGFYSLHDLVHEITEDGQIDFVTQYFSFGDAGGFAICSINGQPEHEEGACFSSQGFYDVQVDGESSQVGISDIEVKDGALYTFVWTPIE